MELTNKKLKESYVARMLKKDLDREEERLKENEYPEQAVRPHCNEIARSEPCWELNDAEIVVK